MSSSLAKKIGFWSATSIIIGSMIGSGVFMKPASMAEQLGSPVWLALIWVIAGIFSLFGALIYAELGAMIPETGGIYVYFRMMFGDFVAFLYGWAAFAVINTAAVAAIAFVCAGYADYFLHLPRFDPATERSITWHIPFVGDLYPLQNMGVKILAIVLVIGLTLLNYISVKAGSVFQVVSTFLKMALIGGLIIGIFISPSGSFHNFIYSESPKTGATLLSGIIAAMTGAFLAYDGWINIASTAGEIKDTQKNIPKSLLAGVAACIVIYVLVNQAYLYVLPVEKMAGSSLVAADAIAVAWGTTGGAIIAAMIVICTLGAINGNTMATARITYAMGQDRVFFSWVGKEHSVFKTPGNALWLHGIWTSLFIITGSFDILGDMFVFVTWIAYGAGALGIFLLRRKMPHHDRPYKMWGYPVVPVLFVLFSAFYLVTTVYNDVTNYLNHRQPVINSVLGIAITAIGIPLFFYFRRKKI
ncbi:MAG: amino acid permease [Chitinophagaceae bacterium]|nr:amino acid permease [Chitinophagaceae bacterium]